MDCKYVRVVTPCEEQGLEISVEPQLHALSDRFAARGLHKAVLNSAVEQIHKEELTRTLAPEAYRLSMLSDADVEARYRRGKSQMTSADLVRYFSDTRARRIRNRDFSQDVAVTACEEDTLSVAVAAEPQKKNVFGTRVLTAFQNTGRRIQVSLPTWFDTAKADTSMEVKRFPLSAFAALLAVAMSLMLIVASSVMLTRAERNISELKMQVADVSDEVSELKSDFELHHDLLEIRRIAIEEYGMVDEDYIKIQRLPMQPEDKVEIFEEEREESVGLDAILSAIGIK